MLGEGGAVAPHRTVEEAREIAAELGRVLRERDQLSLLAAGLAGQLAEVNYGDHMGCINTAEFMRHEFKLGYQQAADLVGVGLMMNSLEESTEAAWTGEIGFQHLVFMARTKRAVGCKPFDETHLLAEAKEVSVGRFWHVCQAARHAFDPEGVAREQTGQVEERALHINQQLDGMVTFRGALDSVAGASVRTALESLAKKEGKRDDRTRERRLADALVELAVRSMDLSSPRQRAHLNITATLGTLLQVPNSAAAEVDYGVPMSALSLKRIACDCSITRHIFAPGSVLIDTGRETRVVSPSQRKALEVRDRHCRYPGCTRPANWCEAHHVVHWIHDGPTNLDNLVLLCSRHHWLVHEGGWQLFMLESGEIEVLKPTLDFRAMPRAPAEAA